MTDFVSETTSEYELQELTVEQLPIGDGVMMGMTVIGIASLASIGVAVIIAIITRSSE